MSPNELLEAKPYKDHLDPQMDKPYFYKITNKVNGKFYYGSGIKKRYRGSGTALNRAQKKYGVDSFTYEILRYFDTREEAFRFEQLFITFNKLVKLENCYNMCRNANGGYISEKAYKKVSEKLTTYRATEEGSTKGKKNPRYNHKIYDWYNIDSGERKSCTQRELQEYINTKGSSVLGYIVRGDRKHHKGWILAENIEEFGTREKLKTIRVNKWKQNDYANRGSKAI